MNFDFAFFMDVSVLVLLAATVYLSLRLSLSLRNFKESRFEMEGLINRLTANIDTAEQAIGGMQNAARGSGAALDKIIKESKFLADELKFMNEAGNNLAGRLEKLAERNRELVDQIEGVGGIGPSQPTHGFRSTKPVPAHNLPHVNDDDDLEAGFAIHDREHGDSTDEDMPPGLQSQAERELFNALRTKGRPRGRTQ